MNDIASKFTEVTIDAAVNAKPCKKSRKNAPAGSQPPTKRGLMKIAMQKFVMLKKHLKLEGKKRSLTRRAIKNSTSN